MATIAKAPSRPRRAPKPSKPKPVQFVQIVYEKDGKEKPGHLKEGDGLNYVSCFNSYHCKSSDPIARAEPVEVRRCARVVIYKDGERHSILNEWIECTSPIRTLKDDPRKRAQRSARKFNHSCGKSEFRAEVEMFDALILPRVLEGGDQ